EQPLQIRSLFRASIIVQGKALISIIQSVVKGPLTADAIGEVVELAYRHNKYGIKMQYYNILGRVLLLALGECTGDELWDATLDLAWRTVYAYMMTAMSPVLYHGVIDPSDEDIALAKQGRFRRDMVSKWTPKITSSSVQPTSSITS
ncbi:hypothetical protein As57867_003096, partial [Aphanomyces stellatus]